MSVVGPWISSSHCVTRRALAIVAESATSLALGVELIKDHHAHSPAAAAEDHLLLLKQHVTIHLCRHHQDVRVAVDLRVTCEEPDRLTPENALQVSKLLVGERLERRSVDSSLSPRECSVEPNLSHGRLARAGGRGENHRAPLMQRVHRVELELVELKREALRKQRERRCSGSGLLAQLGNERGAAAHDAQP
eukprot:scaffold240983_cov30-Tisochrysis_lutea.AAC.5